jgi:hypothetical protein
MTKTPEQMAEEWASGRWYADHDPTVSGELKVAFLAGYKAAKDHILQLEKLLQEANDTVAGMADECEGLKTIIYDHDKTNLPTPAKWISVKERLPEEGEEVLVFGQYLNDIPKVLGVRSRYKGDQDWKYTWEGSDEWVYRENDVTHWMPLPEAPKEEK